MITNCLWCKKLLPIDRLSWHRKFCCREHQNKYIWQDWRAKNPQKYLDHLKNHKRKTLLGSKCVKCQSTKNLHLHHIFPTEYGGQDKKENWAVLCEYHHQLLHKTYREIIGKTVNFQSAFNSLI